MLKNNRKWLIFFSTGIMIMLVNLDMTIVNLALASIASSLQATLNQMQWVISSYLLATALSFTVFGRLADMHGRKKIFLLGVFLFTLGSLGCGLASNITALVIMRFIQGLGFAAAFGLALVITFNSFPTEQRGMVTGMAVTITGLSQTLGPTAGGIIVQHLSWSWVFWINVPLGILSLISAFWVVPADVASNNNKQMSLYNVFSFVMGLALVLYGLNQWTQLNNINLTLCLALGIFLLALFVHSSYKKSNPLINIALLTHKGFSILVAIRFLFMIFMGSLLFIMPLYLQNILGYSAEDAGLILLGMTIFVALSSPIVGKTMDKQGFLLPVLISLFLALLSCIAALFFPLTQNLTPIFISLFFMGLAVGIHTPSTIHGVSKEAPQKDAGTAIGLFFTMAMSGSVIGVALAGIFLEKFSKKMLLTQLDGQYISTQLLDAAAATRSVFEVPLFLQNIVKESFMYAFHEFMFIISALLCGTIMLTLYLVHYHRKLKVKMVA